jgi:transposase
MNAFVGVDVSEDRLDVQVLEENAQPFFQSFPNTPEGCETLLAALADRRVERLVCESSGGYERLLVAQACVAGLPVVQVNARQVRDFAKSCGQLAKTDKLDAAIIARFAQAIRPELRPLPDESERKLKEILARRSQLVAMRTMEKNRLQQAASVRVRRSIEALLKFLEKQLAGVDDDLDEAIRNCPAWQEKADLLRTVPGVGDQTARVLVADLPELGRGKSANVSSLVGVAPMNCESGKWIGKRSIRGGRASVRSTLYMATLTAIRHNPVIAAHYEKLRSAGKAAKVAIVACMRKLLEILHAMVRDNQPWRAQPATAAS